MNLKKGKLVRGIFAALSVLLAFCMLATGCGEKTTPPDNDDNIPNGDGVDNSENNGSTNESQGLESGFDFSDRGCATTSKSAAYKSEKNEFDIDDVTLEFFFGADYSYIENQLANGDNYPEFDMYFENGEGDKIHIKHVEENFVSEKYSCEFVYENGKRVGVIYNYSETLTVPKEIFTTEKGFVNFALYGVNPRTPRLEYHCIVATRFYYKLLENKVVLSSEPID